MSARFLIRIQTFIAQTKVMSTMLLLVSSQAIMMALYKCQHLNSLWHLSIFIDSDKPGGASRNVRDPDDEYTLSLAIPVDSKYRSNIFKSDSITDNPHQNKNPLSHGHKIAKQTAESTVAKQQAPNSTNINPIKRPPSSHQVYVLINIA